MADTDTRLLAAFLDPSESRTERKLREESSDIENSAT